MKEYMSEPDFRVYLEAFIGVIRRMDKPALATLQEAITMEGEYRDIERRADELCIEDIERLVLYLQKHIESHAAQDEIPEAL
jgi:hypothetical protein